MENYSKKVFTKLTTLVGDWEGKTASDKTVKVSYKLIANKTVLTENWDMGNSRTAMTVYHLDDKKLIATHYCPWGNQPRLELISNNDEQKFSFVFVSATNLPDKNLTHQHQFDIKIESSDNFWRSETYFENGKMESEAITYFRMKTNLSKPK